MNSVNVLLQRGRLALQEFGPSMAMLTLPGGYLVALSGLILRRWPLAAGRWPLAARREDKPNDESLGALNRRSQPVPSIPVHLAE